jgi:hypothetical protein
MDLPKEMRGGFTTDGFGRAPIVTGSAVMTEMRPMP